MNTISADHMNQLHTVLGVEIINRAFDMVDPAEQQRLMNLGRENVNSMMRECLSILERAA